MSNQYLNRHYETKEIGSGMNGVAALWAFTFPVPARVTRVGIVARASAALAAGVTDVRNRRFITSTNANQNIYRVSSRIEDGQVSVSDPTNEDMGPGDVIEFINSTAYTTHRNVTLFIEYEPLGFNQ